MFISAVRSYLPAFLALLLSFPLAANDRVYRLLQSGSSNGPASIHDRGIHGEGEIIAILDTGLDHDSCYFAEGDGTPPPVNVALPGGFLEASNVDHTRRKVIAYNFLYSCSGFPGAPGCEDPSDPRAFDNQGHGTHAAAVAAGDRDTPLVHDPSDAIAPGAKLVIQDAGFIGGDNCTQRPGLGCPVRELRPVLLQAYLQGARIHSNSWGDRQNTPQPFTPPTANYSKAASEIDAFVHEHPDMLVIFNTGNAGQLGPSSASAPGVAKNAIQVGGVVQFDGEEAVASFSGRGPTRDGRIKPDLVAPATITAGDTDFDVTTGNCNVSQQTGTSWSAPAVAGAAALVRQYFADGYYPLGIKRSGPPVGPSAALVKAMLISSARRIAWDSSTGRLTASDAVPSMQQGSGVPVLDDVLYFTGDSRRLLILDRESEEGLEGGSETSIRFRADAGSPLKIVLVWTDPPAEPRAASDPAPVLVNDLDLSLVTPDGRRLMGNDTALTGRPDRLNNVEVVLIDQPVAGEYEVVIRAERIAAGERQSLALVVTGDITQPARRRPARR